LTRPLDRIGGLYRPPDPTTRHCMNGEHVLVSFFFLYFLDACQINWQKWHFLVSFSWSAGGSFLVGL
jgi:hypothetical protein